MLYNVNQGTNLYFHDRPKEGSNVKGVELVKYRNTKWTTSYQNH